MVISKEFIDIFAAALAPILAVSALWLSISNHRLSVKKRKDELFDRRYKFYKSFETFWKTTGSEQDGATRMSIDWDEIILGNKKRCSSLVLTLQNTFDHMKGVASVVLDGYQT